MYKSITKVQELGSLLDKLKVSTIIGLDVEATSLDPHSATWLLLQLNIDNEIFILDCRKLGNKILKFIISIIKDRDVKLVGHNLKYDFKIIYHNTKEILTNCYDTMLGEMITNAGLNVKFPSYKELVNKYCFITIDKEVQKQFIDYTGEITNEQLTYSAIDVKHLFDIMDSQLKVIESQKQLKVKDLEMDIVHVFALMEYIGIYVDKKEWLDVLDGETRRREELADIIYKYIIANLKTEDFKTVLDVADFFQITSGNKTKTDKAALQSLSSEFSAQFIRSNFNIGSTYQMQQFLHYIGIPVKNTNEKTLLKYINNEFVKTLLDYRESDKRVSTYGESFLDMINPYTNALHTDYNQLISTGRISSSKPNLQNIPKVDKYRHPFKARPGYKLATVDLSQAELRLMGAVSKEPEFIKAFVNGDDLHKVSATIIYEKPKEEITKEERFVGKTFNFGLIYGISPWGLERNFGIPQEDGEKFIVNYFNGYSYIKEFINQAGEIIWKNKMSVTPMGRRRFFKDKVLYKSGNDEMSYIASIKREGVNHIIQGGVSDVVKIAMLNISKNNPYGIEDLHILLQVHDELVVEIKEDIAEEGGKFIVNEMEKAFQPFLGQIPAVADLVISDKWSKG